MFIVLGLIAVVIIILGLVVVFGKKEAVAPVEQTPVANEIRNFDDATAATNESAFSDSEVKAFEQATGASRAMTQDEINAMNQATSAN